MLAALKFLRNTIENTIVIKLFLTLVHTHRHVGGQSVDMSLSFRRQNTMFPISQKRETQRRDTSMLSQVCLCGRKKNLKFLSETWSADSQHTACKQSLGVGRLFAYTTCKCQRGFKIRCSVRS